MLLQVAKVHAFSLLCSVLLHEDCHLLSHFPDDGHLDCFQFASIICYERFLQVFCKRIAFSFPVVPRTAPDKYQRSIVKTQGDRKGTQV